MHLNEDQTILIHEKIQDTLRFEAKNIHSFLLVNHPISNSLSKARQAIQYTCTDSYGWLLNL